MNFDLLFLPAITGLLVAVTTIPIILYLVRRFNIGRQRRDLHHTNTESVPRLGGLALALAFVAATAVSFIRHPHSEDNRLQIIIVAASLAMFTLGFLDDLRPLGAKVKLFGQVLIATFVYALGLGVQSIKVPFTSHVIELYSLGYGFTVIWLVGMTNLINLIDGVDGLAGGICLMLMGLLSYVVSGTGNLGLLTAAIAGALVGFLIYNFPPAKIYLGDGGAYFLGFQIGLISLISSNKGTVVLALVSPLFVLALPIVDTTLAIARRALRGLPIFRADKRHLHHHMLRGGMSRRQVVLTFYGITLFFLVLGLTAFISRAQMLPTLIGFGAVVLLLCAGRLRFSRQWFAVGRVVGDSLAIREEVQYALSLKRWLELEGARAESVDQLWSEFTFAGRKLNFSQMRVRLPSGELGWNNDAVSPIAGAEIRVIELGRWGRIEFCPGKSLFDVEERNERVLEIECELLAEAWSRAAARLAERHPGVLESTPSRRSVMDGLAPGLVRDAGKLPVEPKVGL